MNMDQVLRPSQSRASSNGAYTLAMQPDGNLVLYANESHRPLWASRTWSPGAFAALQDDGDSVIYSARRGRFS
jgi:hypothetical protein